MKKRISLILIAIVIMIAFGCSGNHHFTIEGHISGVSNGTMVYLFDMVDEVYLDSATITDEKFEFRGKVDYPRSCWLFVDENHRTSIMVENTKSSFSTHLGHFNDSAIISGGFEQQLSQEVKTKQHSYNKQIDALFDSLMLMTSIPDIDEDAVEVLGQRFNKLVDLSHDIYVQQGLKHPNSFYGLDAVYRNRNNIHIDTLKQLYNSLKPKYKKTENGQLLKSFIFDPPVEVGNQYYDFSGYNSDGSPFQLSSLSQSNILLIFWDSYCGACRMFNRFVAENQKIIPDNVQVVSFSLDTNKDKWLVASEEDGIWWTNVSDLRGDKGVVSGRYNIHATPISYLINEQGIILKKFLGFDESLLDSIEVALALDLSIQTIDN